MSTNPRDEPAAQAHALLERLCALLRDCRVAAPQVEVSPTDPELVSAQAERLLYFGAGRRDRGGPGPQGRGCADRAA